MATLSPSNFHPTLRVPLTGSFLTAPESCQAYVLVSLPPALFVDPWQPPVSTSSSAGDTSQSAHITAAHFLAAGDKGNVELEKAVGWTHDKGKIRRRERSGPSSSSAEVNLSPNAAGSDTDQLEYETIEQKKFVAGQGIVTEKIRVVSSESHHPAGRGGDGRNVYAGDGKGNKERESVLFQISTSPQKAVVNNELATQQSEGTTTTVPLSIPLHARYLPPKDPQAVGLQTLFQDLSQSLFDTTDNYFQVSVEGLESFWACSAEQPHLAQQRITRASSLLSSEYKHLTTSLHRTIPHSHNKYLYTFDSIQQEQLPAIRLPTGNASYAELTQLITTSVVWVLALFLMVRISKVKGR
ncbi:unnamed protein product [Sympodiomycopsis kandeliae]